MNSDSFFKIEVYAAAIVTSPPAANPINPILLVLIFYFTPFSLITSIAFKASFVEYGSIILALSIAT